MVIRGLYVNKKLLRLQLYTVGDGEKELDDKVKNFIDPKKTLIWGFIGILFFILLYFIIGILGVVFAALIMGSRLPELINEIRVGEKISTKNSVWSIFGSLLFFAAFPVYWLAVFSLLT